MSDPAVMIALPGLLRAARTTVEEHAPVYAPTAALRWTLIALLDAAVFAADQFVCLTPAAVPQRHSGPQQIHAAVGAGRHAGEPPRVPRFPLGDRPHP